MIYWYNGTQLNMPLDFWPLSISVLRCKASNYAFGVFSRFFVVLIVLKNERLSNSLTSKDRNRQWPKVKEKNDLQITTHIEQHKSHQNPEVNSDAQEG
jgi:hypothetical protein